MPGGSLFDTMAQQVGRECEQNVSAARAQAESIRKDAESKAESQRQAALEHTAKEKELLDLRWRQKAHAEASRANLAVQGAAVDAVLDRVRKEIDALVGSDRFPAILDALMTELMAAAPDGVVALAPERHVDHVRQWLASHGKRDVPVEPSPEVWDGVAVQDPARTFRISNTLTGRYERMMPEARRLCMTELFGGDTPIGSEAAA